MHFPTKEERIEARIARVMYIRSRDTTEELERARREARYDALLARLRAHLLAPRLAKIIADIERTKGWCAHLSKLSGQDRKEAQDTYERLGRTALAVIATLALVRGERPIDEVVFVTELDVAA